MWILCWLAKPGIVSLAYSESRICVLKTHKHNTQYIYNRVSFIGSRTYFHNCDICPTSTENIKRKCMFSIRRTYPNLYKLHYWSYIYIRRDTTYWLFFSREQRKRNKITRDIHHSARIVLIPLHTAEEYAIYSRIWMYGMWWYDDVTYV